MNYKVVISRREYWPPLSIIFVARQNNRNFNKWTELDILLVFWILVAPNANHMNMNTTRDWSRLKQHQHHSMQNTTQSHMFNIQRTSLPCRATYQNVQYIRRAALSSCATQDSHMHRVQNVLMSHIYKEQNHPMLDTQSHIQPACLRTNHMLRLSTTMFWPSTMYHMLVRFPNLTNHMLTVHYHVPIITKVQLTMHYVPCTDHPLQPKPHYSWML